MEKVHTDDESQFLIITLLNKAQDFYQLRFKDGIEYLFGDNIEDYFGDDCL